MAFVQCSFGLVLICASCSSPAAAADTLHSRVARIREAVQPVLDEMAIRWNMSFSFGFTEDGGRLGLAAGRDNVWELNTSLPQVLRPVDEQSLGQPFLKPHTLIPMGSVTKPWTGLRVLQHMEAGRLSLDDAAEKYTDPVLRRLWNTSLQNLWGADAAKVTIRHLLSMRSGFADYDDAILEDLTFHEPGDDVGPLPYLQSASRSGDQGWVCKPNTCGAYSGANFVLLGIVLVHLDRGFSWHEFDQRTVIPRELWDAGRYPHTTFLKFGRCEQYPRIAHQWAVPYQKDELSTANVTYEDLWSISCLNGWTMGNIASTGEDLATFFYDLYTLAPTGKGYVNSTTFELMQQYQPLNDSWCTGPKGPGSCSYGLALFKDQFAQDVWRMADSNADPELARVIGHPGEDWGSGVSPCGYNKAYKFGICIAYTSLYGMNCSMDARMGNYATTEAPCRIYDAVLQAVGGPRLNCSLPTLSGSPQYNTCEWKAFNNDILGPMMDLKPAVGATTRNPARLMRNKGHNKYKLKHKRSMLLAQTMLQLEAQAGKEQKVPATFLSEQSVVIV